MTKILELNFVDWLGFVGIFLILTAYFLHQNRRLNKDSLKYILLNLIGALMACLASILLEYLPFIILEGAWTLVSLNSFVDYYRYKKR